MIAKTLFNPGLKLLPSDAALLAENLLGLIRKRKLKRTFTLNWEPVMQTLETFYGERVRSGYHIKKDTKIKIQTSYILLALTLKKFLPPDSPKQVYGYLRGFLGDGSNGDGRFVLYLCVLLRTDRAIEKEQYECWLKELITLWKVNSESALFNAATLFLLSGLAVYGVVEMPIGTTTRSIGRPSCPQSSSRSSAPSVGSQAPEKPETSSPSCANTFVTKPPFTPPTSSSASSVPPNPPVILSLMKGRQGAGVVEEGFEVDFGGAVPEAAMWGAGKGSGELHLRSADACVQ